MSDPQEELDLLKSSLAATSNCFSIDDLGRYADAAGELAWRERGDAHIKTCVRCQTELSLLQQFRSQEVQPSESEAVAWIDQKVARHLDTILPHHQHVPDPEATAARGRGRKTFFASGIFRPAAALAGLLIVASSGLYLWSHRLGSVPQMKTDLETTSDNYRSGNLSIVAPTGDIGRVPATLVWQPTPDAVRYEIRLMEVNRQVLWKASTGSVSVELPDDVRQQIVPAKTLFWEVEAFDKAGAKIASSGNQRFRVSAKAN
jgi:hypothetical protein